MSRQGPRAPSGGPHPAEAAAVGEDSAVRPWPRLALGLLALLSARSASISASDFGLDFLDLAFIRIWLGFGLDFGWISASASFGLVLVWLDLDSA